MATSTAAFLQTHPVFTLDEAARGTGTAHKRRMHNRLKYQLAKGRVKSVARAVYATVPFGVANDRFEPDRYLVAAAVRPDAVFAYHAALELLGAAHSDWSVSTVLTGRRRPPLALGSTRIEFMLHPVAVRRHGAQRTGTRSVDRKGRTLTITGPERTLLDGFREPDKVGGVSELLQSASGFGVLDLTLLTTLLEVFGERRLYAATGWFLERHQQRFFVPSDYLARLEVERPKAPMYLVRSQRGGRLVPRWNLIAPLEPRGPGEPDEA